jgi:hypothetical protein
MVRKCVYIEINAKMISLDTTPGLEGGGMKENG